MVAGDLSDTIRRMKNSVSALLGLPVLGLLVLALPACNSTEPARSSVEDAAVAPLPEIRYYEIADT